MTLRLRPYARLLVAGIRRRSTYRLAAFGGLVANVTFGFLKAAVLGAALASADGSLRGYDAATMTAYVWLSQALLGSVNVMGRTEVATRIRTGDIAVDLARPLNIQAGYVAGELGSSIFALLPRGVPTVVIGVLAGMRLPSTPAPYLLGALSLLLAFAVSASAVYALSTLGFWLVEMRGFQVLYMVVAGFFSGVYVPVALFPGWLHALATATPFPSMVMYPIDVLSGRATGAAALAHLGTQTLWLLACLVVGELLTRAGRHTLEVQGG